ncbi:acyl-CoA dehydrogenase family protein [Acinetobacter bouvetii]|uniref:Dibenzothiophene desulfurization enzyme C n=1 Tax=Acinetobacter bouvetii TaxID=202951 RepID=A0A811GC75_9GAMM|nr:acyl-CoA dehydrogenase family protein [Acinetobacter bouvetii]CAB1214259.1 Dibenzothiophene desulfurization enzyme C [Acinetobacter bouvetii]
MNNLVSNTQFTSLQQTLNVAELQKRAESLLPKLGHGSAERESQRQLPFEQIRQLAEAHLLTFRIPEIYGGSQASVREVIQFIIDVAAYDSNIAQALRPSFLFIDALLARGTEQEKALWFSRYLDGKVIGNAGWETGGANGEVSSRIVKEGDHYRVTGQKYYSTGGLYSDWISAVALDEQDKPVYFILPIDREGLELVDDFDAMGQRLTASGTTNFNNVIVYEDEIQIRDFDSGKRSIVTPFAQIYLAAVEAGIARNVLNDAVWFTQNKARPIKHSSAKNSVDDPYVEFAVGEIAARAFAAEAAVLNAADSIDAAWAANLDDAAVDHAALIVSKAQFIAIESTLKAAERLFDVGGASTTGRKHNFDRHWRNARTVANHNPRDWKAAAVGAYYLKNEQLPLSGLF